MTARQKALQIIVDTVLRHTGVSLATIRANPGGRRRSEEVADSVTIIVHLARRFGAYESELMTLLNRSRTGIYSANGATRWEQLRSRALNRIMVDEIECEIEELARTLKLK